MASHVFVMATRFLVCLPPPAYAQVALKDLCGIAASVFEDCRFDPVALPLFLLPPSTLLPYGCERLSVARAHVADHAVVFANGPRTAPCLFATRLGHALERNAEVIFDWMMKRIRLGAQRRHRSFGLNTRGG